MTDVTLLERPSSPVTKAPSPTPTAAPTRTELHGLGHRAQVQMLTPKENLAPGAPPDRNPAPEPTPDSDLTTLQADQRKRTIVDGEQKVVEIDRREHVVADGRHTHRGSMKTTVEEGKDNKSSRALSGKLESGPKGKLAASGAIVRKHKDDVGSSESKAEVDFDSDKGLAGTKASASHKRTLSAVKGYEMTDELRVAYADGRVEGKALTRNTTERTDDEGTSRLVTDEKGLTLSGGKGGVGGAVSRRRVVRLGDDSKDNKSTLGYDAKTETAKLGHERVVGNEVSSVKTAGEVGYGKDGVTASLGRERILGDKEKDHVTSGASASYAKGNATLARSEKTRVVGEAGKTETESGQRLVVGKDGVAFGHDQKSKVIAADGSSKTNNVGLTGDVMKGELGVNTSSVRQDKDENETSSLSAGGKVKFGQHGIEKASANVAYKAGTTTIAAKGGYSFVVDDPKQVERNGKRVWQMTVKKELSGGASVSVKGVGVGGTKSASQSMTIVRDTKDELLAMKRADRLEAELRKPADSRTVSSMKAGDERSSSTSEEDNASLEVGLGGLKVGFTFTNGRSQTVTVTRQEGTLVQVRYLDTESNGRGGSLGSGLGGVGGEKSSTSSQSLTLEFDLSTAAGGEAFDKFRRTGAFPRTHARVVSRSVGTSDESSVTSTLAGVSVTDASRVSKSTTHDERGKTEADSGVRTQSVAVPLLGSHQKSAGFHTTELNDETRGYSSSASVASSNASDGAEALADLTGTHTNREASGKGSGTWNVTAEFSEAQVDKLVRLIRHDKVVYAGLFRQYGDGVALRRAVVAAGDDHDKIRAALTVFVSETGAGGLAVIRKAIDVNPSYDVELVGDKFLTGEKVRLELENKKKAFEARAGQAGADLQGLMTELDEAIAFHRARAAAIESHTNYPELSHQLRAGEVGRSREAVAHFGALRRRVAESAREKQQSGHRDDPAEAPLAEQSFVEPSQAVSGGQKAAAECEKPSPEVAARTAAWAEIGAARGRLESNAAPHMERAFAEARRRHWVHNGAWSSVEPRSRIGYENIFGSGRHADDYDRAEYRLTYGKFKLGICTTLKHGLFSEVDAAERANLGPSPLPTAAMKAVAVRLDKLAEDFATIALVFQGVTQIYRSIEAKNPTLRNWEPPQEMPDGYQR